VAGHLVGDAPGFLPGKSVARSLLVAPGQVFEDVLVAAATFEARLEQEGYSF
jgi:hypothetical protein